MTSVTIRLDDNGDAPYLSAGLRVAHGSVVAFEVPCGASIASRPLTLHTNYPQDGEDFNRNDFHQVQSIGYNGHSDWRATLSVSLAGSFTYYLLAGGTRCKEGVIYVDPVLTIQGRSVPVEGVILQTVLPKCLGPFDHWEEQLKFSALSGYNMIHFTPVQELGTSQSSYSIYDQLQLNSKLFPHSRDEQRWSSLAELIIKLETQYGMLSMTDLVWNHTADNSPWLVEHPEAGYNLENSPHLKSAFAFDEAIMQFSESVEGIAIEDEEALSDIMRQLADHVFPKAELWQFFVLDVKTHVQLFKNALKEPRRQSTTLSTINHSPRRNVEWLAEQLRQSGLHSDPATPGDRFHLKVNLAIALSLFSPNSEVTFSDEEIDSRCKRYEEALNILNVNLYRQYDESVDKAMRNMTERVRYEFVSSHGPRWGTVSKKHPLLTSLFTRVKVGDRVIPLANNGWIYNGNPLVDFAGPHSNAYFERSVIVWGDCVKLRYGNGPSDSPWLWQHMAAYTTKMVEIFHGFRIDNCHSTPIHVAQYLLDIARRKRKNIYVSCELFTGSEEVDALYVSQLGITSLIREAMGANDSWELGRLCHRHGGNPVGSFIPTSPVLLKPCLPGALFMDCTHDNETPAQKRTPEDALPNSGVVSMAVSAVGSVRGYDELISKNIDVVHETRKYPLLKDTTRGIAAVKRLLNDMHQKLATEGYSEIHIHQEGNIIAIQRHRPATHEAVYLIVHSAFHRGDSPWHPVRIPGRISEFLFFASISNSRPLKDDPTLLHGLDTDLKFEQGIKAQENVQVEHRIDSEEYDVVNFSYFPPGSVLCVKVVMPEHSQKALKSLHSLLQDSSLEEALSNLSMIDLNVLLYRAAVEEHVSTGEQAYHLNNYGDLVYCGLQGISSVLAKVQESNDLGHPLCNNLREGNWLMDYTVSRLSQRVTLKSIASWLNNAFDLLKQLPRYLIPKYFSAVILEATKAAESRAIQIMSPFVNKGSEFIKALALTSVQLYGIVDSVLISHDAILPQIPDNTATLAAGLTHFATGYMRSWGRDTFISLKGLLLVTGRFTEARLLILAYAACVRHGLVPNLLDSGVRPRYNARDAVWWFLQGVQDYCTMSPEGNAFLSTNVKRLFHGDSRTVATCTMAELIHEILQKHALGIRFREWEAGTAIDDRMQDMGFNIDIHLDITNGFLFGGNEYNCGTWMDKMGESSRAGNRGVPATPRIGAPIEITALLKSTLRWVSHIHKVSPSLFPFVEVKIADNATLSYGDWDALILKHFDSLYFIPENPDEDSKYKITKSLVNRRGIYKDVVGSTQEYAEYQLRPNQCVAFAVAPELFPLQHARSALKMVEDVLIKGAPLGVRTLDPTDAQYCGDYYNTDGADYKTAGGFNYHNGPEWVWPLGYFLEAKILFHNQQEEVVGHEVYKFLRQHRTAIASSPFRGLPELTNSCGAHCAASCEVQAWSSATILSALYHLHHTHSPN